jgi:hypothetical protein
VVQFAGSAAVSAALAGGSPALPRPKGHITLKAAPDAKPVSKQLVPVMAHVSIKFVMKWTYCGEPLFITVESPRPAK